MHSQFILDPILNKPSELVAGINRSVPAELTSMMINDISQMASETKNEILEAMFRMHKYYEDYCGDLDVSLSSVSEIPENTEPWYIILDDSSDFNKRIVRYHYRCNWETSHGVEVVVLNQSSVVFVGNCGYFSSLEDISQTKKEDYNFA
jgi:hypothetical protein